MGNIFDVLLLDVVLFFDCLILKDLDLLLLVLIFFDSLFLLVVFFLGLVVRLVD